MFTGVLCYSLNTVLWESQIITRRKYSGMFVSWNLSTAFRCHTHITETWFVLFPVSSSDNRLQGQSNSTTLVRTMIIITKHLELGLTSNWQILKALHCMTLPEEWLHTQEYRFHQWYLVWLAHQTSSRPLFCSFCIESFAAWGCTIANIKQTQWLTPKATTDCGNPRVWFPKTESLRTVYIRHAVTVVQFL